MDGSFPTVLYPKILILEEHFSKVWVNDIHSLNFIHYVGDVGHPRVTVVVLG